MKKKDLGFIYNDLLSQKIKHSITISLLTIVLVIYILPFLNFIIFVDEEIRMPNDVGYILKWSFDEYSEEEFNQNIIFDTQIEITKYRYDIQGEMYILLFSDPEIFDFGMIESSFSNGVILHQFGFIYGQAYKTSDQVVISENVSQRLFQTTNSINQQIEIDGRMFVVVGVIESNEYVGDYIYLSQENIDLIPEEENIFNDGYILKDDQLFWKIYQKGGYDLLTRTSSYLSQSEIPSLYFSLILIIIVLLQLVGFTVKGSKEPIDIDELRRRQKIIDIRIYKEMGVLKYTFQHILYVFYATLYLYGLAIAVFSSTTSLLIAPLVLIEYPLVHFFVLLFLLAVFIDVLIKIFQTRKKKEINQLRLEYLKIKYKMIKPYIKRVTIPLVIILVIVMMILIIIYR